MQLLQLLKLLSVYNLLKRAREMGSTVAEKPHAVCIPYPAQGHINPMLHLAKLLHFRGFHITFVLTKYNYNRLVRTHGPDAVKGFADFRFEAIPDGLPISDDDTTQDIPALSKSTAINCLDPFRDLLSKLNSRSPPLSSIFSDVGMTFTLDVAHELGIPEILLWTASACSLLACVHFSHLVNRGLIPLKDIEDVTNGYLDTKVDWIPGLIEGMSLKDFPSFIRTTDPDDIMLNFVIDATTQVCKADAIIINTFDELEATALAALQKILPPVYTVGPLSLLSGRTVPSDSHLAAIAASLWKQDNTCLNWLNGKESSSVVYVNFGSITVMSNEQLLEFAWGLTNSGYDFVWVIRPDLVRGESAVLPLEYLEKTKERRLMPTWCPQEALLSHPAIGVFLTHSGWNSTLESFCGGVPMICWPFFGDQQINCKYACAEWGVGMEIENRVNRGEVENLIREMMGGEKGRELRKRAVEWKERAAMATDPHGSSAVNLDKVVKEVLRSRSLCSESYLESYESWH